MQRRQGRRAGRADQGENAVVDVDVAGGGEVGGDGLGAVPLELQALAGVDLAVAVGVGDEEVGVAAAAARPCQVGGAEDAGGGRAGDGVHGVGQAVAVGVLELDGGAAGREHLRASGRVPVVGQELGRAVLDQDVGGADRKGGAGQQHLVRHIKGGRGKVRGAASLVDAVEHPVHVVVATRVAETAVEGNALAIGGADRLCQSAEAAVHDQESVVGAVGELGGG